MHHESRLDSGVVVRKYPKSRKYGVTFIFRKFSHTSNNHSTSLLFASLAKR